MRNNRQKKGANAFVISIVMHLVLFGLLIVSSFYHTVEIMGGGEGDGECGYGREGGAGRGCCIWRAWSRNYNK